MTVKRTVWLPTLGVVAVLVGCAFLCGCRSGGEIVSHTPGVGSDRTDAGGARPLDGGTPPPGSASDAGAGGNADGQGTAGDSGTNGDSGTDADTDTDADTNTGAIDPLKGYWVWEKRMLDGVQQTSGDLGDCASGQMKLAFGTGNNKGHYIWNEITGSDFHTEFTYTVSEKIVTLSAKTLDDGRITGYSCAHPDWTSWANDVAEVTAVQYSSYKFVGDRLWMEVHVFWGGVDGRCNMLKRFPFWYTLDLVQQWDSWMVFKPVTRAEWYGKYAISTNCQGTPDVCAQWPGCGYGDKGYVD